MKRTVDDRGGWLVGALALAVVAFVGASCSSVKRDLYPMTDAEAVRRYERDPRVAPQSLAERERAEQERHWFEENRRR